MNLSKITKQIDSTIEKHIKSIKPNNSFLSKQSFLSIQKIDQLQSENQQINQKVS